MQGKQPSSIQKNHLNRSVTHFSNHDVHPIVNNYSQLKYNMPAELIYTQEERNSKL